MTTSCRASSLILADDISPVAAKDVGVGMFVMGSMKVRPKLDQSFSTSQPLGIYMQLYNLKVDDKTHKNNTSVDIEVMQGDQEIKHVVQTGEQLHQSGDQLTLQDSLPPGTLPPGKYKLTIKATDALANQTISKDAEFTVTPGAANAVSQTTSTR